MTRAKLKKLSGEAAEKDLIIGKSTNITRQNEELTALLEKTTAELAQTEAARAEAQDDAYRQRQANKELLDKLLKDQQRLFDDEMRDMKQMIAERTREWREAAERRSVVEKELKDAREEVVRLNDQLKNMKPQKKSPPKERPKEKSPPTKPDGKKKGTSPLGDIDLDEGPDAPPIAEQLARTARERGLSRRADKWGWGCV